jgi:O-acetyl-ADP-ribose deacetylase (regulator of RNase III)
MIVNASGNLLQADASALVNTVNTVGVMGKGIALQMKQAFPEMYKAYRRAAQAGEIQPGRMHVFYTGLVQPKYIINFPTKRHWKGRSRLDDIRAGLLDLVRIIREKGIESIAVPPLGCGSGGLNWGDVYPLIIRAFETLPTVRVMLYGPSDGPSPDEMPIATTAPRMTRVKAALLLLFARYVEPGYRLSLLEVQKLAYFLQVAGEPMSLQFKKAKYGPYAEPLNHVLQQMEGHFIRGYGDRKQGVLTAQIHLNNDDVPRRAEEVLAAEPETAQRLARVERLIRGFETPYGMELLATVHWIVQEVPAIAEDVEAIAGRVHAWNQRKRTSFTTDHVASARKQLRRQGWI